MAWLCLEVCWYSGVFWGGAWALVCQLSAVWPGLGACSSNSTCSFYLGVINAHHTSNGCGCTRAVKVVAADMLCQVFLCVVSLLLWECHRHWQGCLGAGAGS